MHGPVNVKSIKVWRTISTRTTHASILHKYKCIHGHSRTIMLTSRAERYWNTGYISVCLQVDRQIYGTRFNFRCDRAFTLRNHLK